MAVTARALAQATEDAFIRCRTYLHAWEEFYPIGLDAPAYGWRLSLRCTRCTSERHDNVGFTGQLMGRRYIYALGYLRVKGDPKPSRTVFREELFSQLRAKLEESNSVGGIVPIKKPRKRARKSAA